jgi:hypothetical protein
MHAKARWAGSGLAVGGGGTKPYIAPANALATTHWNSHMLHGPMIGVQDGMLVHPIVSPQPRSGCAATSNDIRARHYTLSSDLDLELWYVHGHLDRHALHRG